MISKNKYSLITIALLMASLIIGPVQIVFASTTISSHAYSQKKECKHSNSEKHSSAGHHTPTITTTHLSANNNHSKTHHETVAEIDIGNQDCQCQASCSKCCGGHTTVVLLDIEYNRVSRPHTAKFAAKIYQYKQIFLPVKYHPPTA